MKRKRNSDDVKQVQRDSFYNRDEVLLLTLQLLLEFNMVFNQPRDDLTIYHYATTINNVEYIAKINIILQACVDTGIQKTLDDIVNIINESPINVNIGLTNGGM